MPGHSQRNSITADRWKRKLRGSYAVFQVFAEVAGCVMMIGESGTNLPEETRAVLEAVAFFALVKENAG